MRTLSTIFKSGSILNISLDQPPFPFVLGAELAGRISKDSPIPPGCPFKRGDRVFGAGQGSYADKAAVSWKQLLPVPKNLTFRQASGLFVTWPTSYEALTGRAQLQAGRLIVSPLMLKITHISLGEWCLVHAGAGMYPVMDMSFVLTHRKAA